MAATVAFNNGATQGAYHPIINFVKGIRKRSKFSEALNVVRT